MTVTLCAARARDFVCGLERVWATTSDPRPGFGPQWMGGRATCRTTFFDDYVSFVIVMCWERVSFEVFFFWLAVVGHRMPNAQLLCQVGADNNVPRYNFTQADANTTMISVHLKYLCGRRVAS